MIDTSDIGRWLVVAVFALTWFGISARRVHLLPIGRPAMALVGAVSTLAGNLTLLGSVANIIVVERAGERLGFFEYLKVGVLVTAGSTAFSLASLWLLW